MTLLVIFLIKYIYKNKNKKSIFLNLKQTNSKVDYCKNQITSYFMRYKETLG